MRRSSNHAHFRMLTANRQDQASIRTSDIVLAAVGVGLLAGFCLMLIAGIMADPENLASTPLLTGNS